ncbi:hypothetical protein N7476_000570 [Penicillium atrosanguineum]|uniref:F-box domain-containing protein n=1 Tax=Penicillium atrosanguineum TaxID=1132637 RepID=A0A9W9QGX0_9EURO|nr:hypothetical protein N7476_000570 [Penicillium atrosanguineum]
MVSAFGFLIHRARHGSASSNKKQRKRPPPLHLEDSFVKGNNKRNAGMQAMKLATSAQEDKGSETVPVKMRMEIKIPGSHSVSPESIQGTEFPDTVKPSETLAEEHRELLTCRKLERKSESGSTSEHASLRTFYQLGNHEFDSDPNISPISDGRPPARSTSVLARFFPELSSNLHIVSPTTPDLVDQNMRSLDYASIFENEREDRLETLYKGPQKSKDGQEAEIVDRSSPESGKSLYSGQDNLFDCASSSYSHRTSLTSINTDCLGERIAYKSADAYSMCNPVSAGKKRKQYPSPRMGRLAPEISMEELKNKPLPLEPIQEPSPLAIRRPSPSWNISPQSCSQSSTTHQSSRNHLVTIRRQRYKEFCHECGSHREHRSRLGAGQEWHGQSQNQQMRRGPTMSQATKELECALADLTEGSASQQRTLLILDGPLQVSRHNGDLVATRPAPRPPPIAPHSQSHPDGPLEVLRPAKGKNSWSNKSPKSESTRKEQRPSNLQSIIETTPKEKISKATKSKDSSTKKSIKVPKASEELKGRRQPTSQPSVEKIGKPKLKKSFTLSIPSFSRKTSNTHLQNPEEDYRLGAYSSRSENSSNVAYNRECHSPHRASSTSLAERKRGELLLQLPRLQTQDLETSSVIDSQTRDQEQGPTRPAGLGLANTAGDAALHPLLRASPPDEEKILIGSRMWNPRAFVSTAQASSVHITPEQIYELDATPPSPSARPKPARENKHVPINVDFPVDMPKSLILAIMERIESLDDLFNFVLVNRRFYSIFKDRELYMIKSALFKMSPPAWELREMSPPWENEWAPLRHSDSRAPEYTPTTYLDRYASDIYTLARLKSMILVRCSSFLRRDTIHGLSGADPIRLEEVDDAFWRIWTFCRIFGSGKDRENDLEGQVDWLKGGAKARNYTGAISSMTEPFEMNNLLFEPPEGFARGNCGGLSQKQMYYMTEIWTCLGVLLQDMHGKVTDARAVGILDVIYPTEDDTVQEDSTIEEWTSYILTLGLSAVLTLSSQCPAKATAETYELAKSLGLTKWELTETKVSRSSFLKEAISRAYEEQERALSTQPDSPRGLNSRELDLANAEAERAREQRNHTFKNELRALRLINVQSNNELASSFSNERPMSEYSISVRDLDGSISRPSVPAQEDVPPVPPVPPLFRDGSSTSTSSTTPTTPSYIHPPENTSNPYFSLFPRASSNHPPLTPTPLRPQVQDPVDRAMSRMVHELGFNEDDVKWALKITDRGEGIDGLAAEHLLQKERRKQQNNPFAPRSKNSLLHSVLGRQESQDSGWRWA